MRAFVLHRYGGPEAAGFREIPVPQHGPGEVLVRVMAAGLNPVDFKTRKGKLKPVLRFNLPVVMGNEMAGIVEAVGSDVTRFAVGDRVFARVPKDRMGALAEFAAIPEDVVATMPDGITFEEAASVPLAGLTALQALRDELQLGPGSRVLIPGGAGGVGTLAIQLAKWLGAEVTTTASPRGRALVKRVGADHVIDYTREKIAEQAADMDGAFDLIGGETLDACFAAVKPGGMVVSITATPEPETARHDLERGWGLRALFWAISLPLRLKARRHGVRYRFLFMHPSGAELAELAALMSKGRLTPIVDRVFSFEETAAAFAYLEAGHAKGKVVVRIG